MLGLPRKNGVKKSLFDYELILYKALLLKGYLNSNPMSATNPNYNYNVKYPFKEKRDWIKKTTGLGVTEFILRFMA